MNITRLDRRYHFYNYTTNNLYLQNLGGANSSDTSDFDGKYHLDDFQQTDFIRTDNYTILLLYEIS